MEANFTTKKISKKDKKRMTALEKLSNSGKKKIIFRTSVIIPLAIIIVLIIGIAKAISKINFSVFLEIAGDELLADSFGHTNFLILGKGGLNHEGGDLTDTIMVASMDKENKLITIISIPRDYYSPNPEIGYTRINEIYYYAKKNFQSSREGIEHMKEKVEELMGVPIHYWVMIDFKGFKELIDAMGGIDVEVTEAIYDPYYPKDGTFDYETFSISAGQHHLDGETALKYARSRKTTSDFDRADRQQKIIFAIKEKALQTEILLNQDRLNEILKALKENLETNISVKEILTLGSLAQDFSSDRISHRLMHDDPYTCGGFLYTPIQQFTAGMFVLAPAGSEKYVHWYSDLNFNTPYIKPETTKIAILNGTKKGGTAGETKQVLQRYCFDVVSFGNAKSQDLTETTYYYKEVFSEDGKPVYTRPPALDFFQKIIPGKESTIIPEEYKEEIKTTDLIIEIGSDYRDSADYLEDPFYGLTLIWDLPKEEETVSTDAAETEADPAAAQTTPTNPPDATQ